MTRKSPLVVAVLPSNADDKKYKIRCDAYGLEMQLDDEWHVELALLAPYEYLNAVTKETGITREAIVSAGITNLPPKNGGGFDCAAISDAKNNWLLLGQPGSNDSDQVINAKLRTALSAGCRAVLCVADPISEQLAARIQGIQPSQLKQLVIAYLAKSEFQELRNIPAIVRASVKSKLGESTGIRTIVGGHVTEQNARGTIDDNALDGILLLDNQYGDFCPILNVLRAVGE